MGANCDMQIAVSSVPHRDFILPGRQLGQTTFKHFDIFGQKFLRQRNIGTQPGPFMLSGFKDSLTKRLQVCVIRFGFCERGIFNETGLET